MSDKELDKLFQDNFESFEVAPSAGLWDKIGAELGTTPAKQQKKKIFPIFWMAAASVSVILGAGLYFMQPQETIKLHGNGGQNQLAQNNASAKKQPVKPTEPNDVATSQVLIQPVIEKEASTRAVVLASSGRPAKQAGIEARAVVPVTTAPDISTARALAVNAVPVKNITDINPGLAPDTKVPASSLKAMPKTTAMALLDNDQKLSDNNEAAQDAPKRKIKSIGDLVNRVVAKVDPREEKIIQFSDNDEGTEVSGINLGLIKFKHNHNK